MNLPGSRDSMVKNCVTSEIEFLSLSLSFFFYSEVELIFLILIVILIFIDNIYNFESFLVINLEKGDMLNEIF